ncbi:hypothetical protein [Pseudalkalibacillus sp. SCS-8]|uniref:hypothetical protein n=1 Tax=Pseudalkalibacillus nanhaiensis TaxID=3115291 RepID=UPI0032DA2295
MKQLIFIVSCIMLLAGCTISSTNGLPEDIKEEMEEHVGFNVSLPEDTDYEVSYVDIQFPPEVNGKANGSRHVADIAFSENIGKKKDLPSTSNEDQKVLYGPYEGDSVITLTISNMPNQMSDAKEKKIKHVTVEYAEANKNGSDFLFISFNTDKGSFFTTFHLSEELTEEDAWSFIQKLVDQNT